MENNSTKGLNIITLARLIKHDWLKMGITLFLFAAFGTWAAFQIPKFYKTTATLSPEESSSSLGNISSLASMVGMNMKFGESSDAIYPEIYPDLVGSSDFLIDLFHIPVQTQDGKLTTTFYDYRTKHQKAPWWAERQEELRRYIQKKYTHETDGPKGAEHVDPMRLTKEQYDVMKALSGDIKCSVDKKTSVITIEVSDQDPLIATTVADTVMHRLQSFITEYRTTKAKRDLAYMQKLYNEADSQYTAARRKYAAFCDANADLELETYRSEQEDLENDMQLKYNIYTQLVEQLQRAKAKVQERTPIYTILQRPTVPVRHANKPKVFTLAVFLIIGFTLRLLRLLYKHRHEVFGYEPEEKQPSSPSLLSRLLSRKSKTTQASAPQEENSQAKTEEDSPSEEESGES